MPGIKYIISGFILCNLLLRPKLLAASQIIIVVSSQTPSPASAGTGRDGHSHLLVPTFQWRQTGWSACVCLSHTQVQVRLWQLTKHYIFHCICAFCWWSHCLRPQLKGYLVLSSARRLGHTNQRKMYVWNKCCQAQVTLLLDMHTNVKETTVFIRGAISKQKHIKSGLHRLSGENAMNTDSQEYSPEFLDDLLHLLLRLSELMHHKWLLKGLKELKRSSYKMWAWTLGAPRAETNYMSIRWLPGKCAASVSLQHNTRPPQKQNACYCMSQRWDLC